MSWEKNLSQYNQIGNAVCPPVAAALGRSLALYITGLNKNQDSIVPIIRQKLNHIVSAPKLATPLPRQIIDELRSMALELGQEAEFFRSGGFDIPSAALPLALILADAELCPLCSHDMAPYGRHGREFCFLISKDGNDSLIENEQDHGLDYHLRSVLGLCHQVGHFVGERLSQLGFVELISVQNPRTGRNVRGMRVLNPLMVDRIAAQRILATLRMCVEAEDHRLSVAVG